MNENESYHYVADQRRSKGIHIDLQRGWGVQRQKKIDKKHQVFQRSSIRLSPRGYLQSGWRKKVSFGREREIDLVDGISCVVDYSIPGWGNRLHEGMWTWKSMGYLGNTKLFKKFRKMESYGSRVETRCGKKWRQATSSSRTLFVMLRNLDYHPIDSRALDTPYAAALPSSARLHSLVCTFTTLCYCSACFFSSK